MDIRTKDEEERAHARKRDRARKRHFTRVFKHVIRKLSQYNR